MENTQIPIWKQVNFVKLWLSQTFNALAHILLQVVVMVQVYKMTNSIVGSASVLAIMSLSLFISGLIASKIIDRYSMKNIIHFAGWARAFLSALIGYFLTIETYVGLIGLFGAIIINSFINAWYNPARFALLPLIVSNDQYVKANGTLVMIQQMLMAAGWALGGILIAFVWFPYIILIICLAYISSGITVYFIKLDEKENKDQSQENKVPAWIEVWRIPVVRSITIMETIEGFSNAIWTSALLLAFATVILDAGEEWWGFLNASYFLGAIIGSFIVTFNARTFSNSIGLMIGLSGLSMGVFTILFSINSLPIIAVLLCVLMGPIYQARSIFQVTVLQDAIPAQRRAGIMAARNAFLTPWQSINVLIVGYLADLIGVQNIYLLCGVLYLVAGLIAFQQKSLRSYKFNQQQASSSM
ncbi:major facilitator superfamily MFS_1 [Caldalkalibacillus thermarum TA2.A1]|uniref:MFS transporter n=1 Tax=Caldalkalibacillus thermarum (strain TA2.A1) TaxID=986075 RepID=F5LBA2_CALTT|nr:MFS transporter [Caldalkalibacillus thermarum]EGL81380.1 major facilitator superfamily MFS_1 [Caldalkalibacillus thermarum TA2.A1]QZT33057.1 MFS transporter [Caldalkalibacillus thermarum TA2.A1]